MRLRVTVEGMVAVHAKRALFTALAGVPGVQSAEVEMGSALVDCDRGAEAAVRQAIVDAGFSVGAVTRMLPTL